MNGPTLIVLAGVLCLVCLAIRAIVKNKKAGGACMGCSGGSGCSCGCRACESESKE
ncbi:MAG: FeoB-associated Cys-rich membrane protein [Emergencia sp.]